MRPSDILDLLDTALPEIKRTGDPAASLLKVAHAENLAPAQLEKMAQLYNTAKNLTYMQKSATRGGSFSIIDTEALLSRYTEQEKKASTAAWQPEMTKAAATDSWFDAPAEDEFNLNSFPDIEILEMRAAIKQAAAITPEPSEHDKRAHALVEARNHQTLEQVQDDAREAAYTAFRKFAAFIHREEIPYHEVEDDMQGIVGPEIGITFKALSQFNPGFKQASSRPNRLFYYDRHGAESLVREMHEAVDTYLGATQLLKEAGTSTQAPPDRKTRRHNPLPQPVPDPQDTTGQEPDRRDNRRPRGGQGITIQMDGPSGEAKAPAAKAPDQGGFGKSMDQFLEAGQKAKPVSDLFGMIAGKDGLRSLKGKNTGQMMVDTAADDAQHTAVMERLLITDPILSKSDPGQVTELANSIRQANPDAANDINFMRFALREALQYGSMPSHTYKDLLGMRKDRAQAEQAERGNSNDEYGGGQTRI